MPAENLHAKFHIHPVLQAEDSRSQGRPVYKDEVYVQIQIKGQKNQIFSRKMREQDKYDFPREWAMFKEAGEVLKSGTPITALPGVVASLELELKGLGIKTVEDMAALSDSGVDNIMGGRMLQQRAKAYLKALEIEPEKHDDHQEEPVDVEALEKDETVVKKPKVVKKRKYTRRKKV